MKRSVSYRLAVTSRVLAALLGGYALASVGSVCLALLVPMAKVDAVVSGMMLSFVLYLLAVIWCFASRTAWRAWLGLLVPGALMALVAGLTWWRMQP